MKIETLNSTLQQTESETYCACFLDEGKIHVFIIVTNGSPHCDQQWTHLAYRVQSLGSPLSRHSSSDAPVTMDSLDIPL